MRDIIKHPVTRDEIVNYLEHLSKEVADEETIGDMRLLLLDAAIRAVKQCYGVAENRALRPTHYVHCNSGDALFVKEAGFFEEQGGLREEWGRAWKPVVAYSIGHARRQAALLFNVPLSHIHAGEV